ncbi:hypothetical protein CNMCM7691_001155 [Aspergillus felis]|uniref:AB hydrolase-1 domain-containing protein n=1 Tax=Aspergillus felis TaxID=1287682 RepID=A0A8H6V7J5_9EURO|nr:hypothetical protein CNMCM7691_001155 [Aspergillus felis]
MFGGITEDGKYGFDPTKGVLLENLMQLKAPPYMSTEEISYYTDRIAQHGIHAPLNWYRTMEINQKDELAIIDRKISVPVLFIQALKDLSLPPQLAEGMGEVIPQLTIEKIDTGHWALVEDPETINGIIAGWLAKIGAESV